MDKSPNIGLTLTPESATNKNFIDFRRELAGDTEDSNMMIIDKKFGEYDSKPITWGMLKYGLGYTGTP